MTDTSSKAPFRVFQEARDLLGAKRYRDAHSLCRKTVLQDRTNADAYYVMGVIAYEHKDLNRALKLFEMAIEQGHPEAGPLVQAARCLVLMNSPEQALEYVEVATKLDISDGFTLASIASLLSRLDRHEDAIVYHRKATEIAPQDPLNFYNFGSSLLFIGDIEAAKSAYEQSLKLAPQFTPSRVRLAQLIDHTSDSNHLAELTTAWKNRHPQDVEGGLQIAHALAKVHEDLGDFEQALVWLEQGKALVRAVVPSRQKQDAAAFASTQILSKTLSIPDEVDAGGPIFILCLPRSGTTLVDRILSSHTDVVSAGERTEFGACLFEAVNPSNENLDFAEAISRSADADLLAVGTRYLERLSVILQPLGRFTDKMPINILFAPAILAALPSAKVICLRRGAADSVLSMYRQLFDVSAHQYRCTHDRYELAHYVVGFRKLLRELESGLPNTRFKVVDYEALATQPEPVIRDMLDFCDLPFEQACIDFQNNSAPTATASVTQVRRAMHTSSIGKWKDYQAGLKPALDILRDHHLID